MAEESRRPIPLAYRLSRPFQQFAEIEASSAILLLLMTLVALAWANSPFHGSYEHLLEFPIAFSAGAFEVELSFEEWVNDALMAIFFFTVGMEIKREMVRGELSTRERAMLPVLGALGGMVAPALIYTSFHAGDEAIRGWGIPMATDIAFAVAALSVFGSRVPYGLRVFLLALAIADDLGAVAVIAIFYTDDLALSWLGLAAATLVLAYLMNRAGVRSYVPYMLVGAFAWLCTLYSGVHATVAGVALGFLTPTTPEEPDRETLVSRGRHALERLLHLMEREEEDQGGHQRHHELRRLEELRYATLSPLDRLANGLEPWVAYLIMPVFAFSNAGVAFGGGALADPMAQRVGLAVALGLLFGKPIGITLFSWLSVRTGIAALPRGVNWSALTATGVLAGIGFTVALFVTNLAFPTHPTFTDGSKIGILAGSATATVLGLAILSRALPRPTVAEPADGTG
jgi:NhaA family Na+:H+ antiporter